MSRMPRRTGAASRPTRLQGKGNKDTEIALARLLRANHISRWRRHPPPLKLPSSPRLRRTRWRTGGKVGIGDGKRKAETTETVAPAASLWRVSRTRLQQARGGRRREDGAIPKQQASRPTIRKGTRPRMDARQRVPTNDEATERRARRARPTTISVDFIFLRERVVVFVDGCFW